MEAESVRRPHQRSLTRTFWLQPLAGEVSVLPGAEARGRLTRERSSALGLWPSVCYWSVSEKGHWER